jgi:hypothetical protein
MTDVRGQQKLEKDQKQYLSPASLEPTESQRLKRSGIKRQMADDSKNQRTDDRGHGGQAAAAGEGVQG